MNHNTRKLNILHELDIAIKRKTQQRSREAKNPLSSIEKRRPSHKSVMTKNKSQEKQLVYRNRSPSKEEGSGAKHLFNNENLKGLELSDKKFHNKKMDKLISLINYVLSSAEKMVKYVNITNFEAEFAVKLFRSDRDTLLSELDGFSIDQIVLAATQKTSGKSQGSLNFQNHALRNENTNLKKEVMILEAECNRLKEEKSSLGNQLKTMKYSLVPTQQRKSAKAKDRQISNLIKEINDMDENKRQEKLKEHQLKHHLFLKEKEIEKLSELLKQIMDSKEMDTFIENLDKVTKFNMIIFNNPQNQKKKAELEIIILQLDNECKYLLKDIANEFSERQEVIRLLVSKAPEILEQQVPDVNLDEIKIVEVLGLLLSLATQSKQPTPRQNSKSKEKQYQQAIQRLKQQMSALSKHNDQLRKDSHREPAEAALSKTLTRQNDALRVNIDELSNKLKQLCVSAQLPMNEVFKMDSHKMVEELRVIVSRKRKQKSKQQQDSFLEKQQLQEVIRKLEAKNVKDQENHLQQMRQLRIHLGSLQQENKQLQKHKTQHLQAKRSFRESETTIQKLNSRIKDMQFKLKEAELLQHSNARLNEEMTQMQKYKQESIASKKAVFQLELSLNKERANSRSISEEYNELKNYRVNLQAQLKALNDQLGQQRESRTQIENKWKEEAATLNKQLEVRDKKIGDSSQQIKRLKDQTIQLSQGLKLKSKQLQSKVMQLHQKAEQVQARDTLNSQLIERLGAELKERNQQIERLNSLNKQLLVESKAFEERAEDQKNQIEAVNGEASKYRQQIQSLNLQNRGIRGQLINAQEELQKQKEHIFQLERQKLQIQRECSKHNEQIMGVREQCLRYRSQIVNLKQVGNELSNQSSNKLEKAIKQLREQLTMEQTLNKQSQQRLDRMSAQRTEAANELKGGKRRIEELLCEKSILEKEVQHLNEKIRELNGQTEQTNKNAQRLEEQLQQLRSKEDQYTSQMRANEEQVCRLLQQNNRLIQQSKALHQQLQGSNVLKQELEQLKVSRALEDEGTTKLGQEYNKLKSDYEQINSTNLSYLEELRELREITVSNNELLKEQEQKLKHLYLTNTTLLEQNQSLNNQLLAQSSNQPVSQSLQSGEQELNSRIAQLTAQKGVIERKLQQYTQVTQTLRKQMEVLSQQKQQMSGMAVELNQKLRQQIENSEKQTSELQSQIFRLQQQLQTKINLVQETTGSDETIRALENRIEILNSEKEYIQTTNKSQADEIQQLNLIMSQVKLQVSALEHSNTRLTEQKNRNTKTIKNQQSELTSLRRDLEMMRIQESTCNLYKEQYQALRRLHEETEEERRIIQKVQQSRMNLIKIIAKKIMGVDDIEYKDINELLEIATKVVVEWKQNQPSPDSATPKKYVQPKESLSRQPSVQENESVGLSGCGDASISEMSKSFVDEKKPVQQQFNLNLSAISRGQDKGQGSEPATSIQDRLRLVQPEELARFLKTQESLNEAGNEEMKKNEQQDLVGGQKGLEAINEERQQSIKEKDDAEGEDKQQDEQEKEDAGVGQQRGYSKLQQEPEQQWAAEPKQQPEQARKVAEQIPKTQQVTTRQNIKSEDNQSKEQCKQQSNQQFPKQKPKEQSMHQDESEAQQKVSEQVHENEFGDFKDIVDTSQLDSSNIQENHAQHEPQLLILSSEVAFGNVLDSRQSVPKHMQQSLQKEQKVSEPSQEVQNQSKGYSNDFQDFKDIANNSALESSSIMPKSNTSKQQSSQEQKHQQIGQQRQSKQGHVNEHNQHLSQQFPDVGEADSPNNSIVSNLETQHKEKVQVGESQFPDFQDNSQQLTKSLVQNSSGEVKGTTDDVKDVSASQFEDYKQQPMSQSMVSNNQQASSKQQPHHEKEVLQTAEQKKAPQENQEQKKPQQEDQASLGDFGDAEPQQLAKSFISQQKQEKQGDAHEEHAFDDFGSVHEELSKSQIEGQQQISSEHGFQNFHNDLGQVLNSSIISEKMETHEDNEEHGSEQQGFSNYLEEADVRSSVIRKKEE